MSINIGDTTENLILVNKSDRVIPVYESMTNDGNHGKKIGYIAIGERYAFAKKDGYAISRRVIINTGGNNTKEGRIQTSHIDWSSSGSGYLSFMDKQERINSLRSSGDYITMKNLEGVSTVFARYVVGASVTLYNRYGVAVGSLPQGTQVLTSSSVAGESNMRLMSFEYKLLPGKTAWEPLYSGTWGWLDMISTGTVSGAMNIS